MDYSKTALWKHSLGLEGSDEEASVEFLRSTFDSVRRNGSYLLDKIRRDFPNLTMHDITHVDSLWQVASIITGADFPINPLEGFVLGCAFVMHDAVLSYEAAGGQEVLRATDTWKDYYSDYKNNPNLTPEQQLYEADFKAIRLLHAAYAEELYTRLFYRDDGSSFYLIENESIRNRFGDLICRIAASHHWDIERIDELGVQFSVPSDFPHDWRINPIKLSCILRCADAGHIDSGRAPDYLLKILEIKGVSRDHWVFQNKLSQIDIDIEDESRAVIRSSIKFKEEDYSAWNVAYEAVCVLNKEITASNELLRKHKLKEFQVKAISGASSQESMCKYIETDGWKPCDASIHISNVEDLIRNLGGEKLYGTDNKLEIVLRELIQNSRDAIQARLELDPGIEGKITVSFKKDNGKVWVCVSDNGVGMSLRAIKEHFLNFGSSYWVSDLCKSECPGLASSGYKSIGKFGIGFYAVFMVSSEVFVETRRYNMSLDDSLIVKFPMGLTLHPIIADSKSSSTSISTVVRFSLDPDKCEWNETKTINNSVWGKPTFVVPYSAVLSNLTAGLDVDVYYSENENPVCVHRNITKMKLNTPEVARWLKDITYANYLPNKRCSDYIDNNYKRVKEIKNNNRIYGYAALNTCWGGDSPCFSIKTVGGLNDYTTSSHSDDYLGIVFAEPKTVKRDGEIVTDSKTIWAKQQYDELCKSGLSIVDKLYLPYQLGKYGIDMTEELLVRVYDYKGKQYILPLKDLLFSVNEKKCVLVIPVASWTENYVEVHMDNDKSYKMLSSNELLFVPDSNSSYLSLKRSKGGSQFKLIDCISALEERYSLSLSYEEKDKKAVSTTFGECKGLVISGI